jgi:putative flippase GtrA
LLEVPAPDEGATTRLPAGTRDAAASSGRIQGWLAHPLVRHPLVRRITGYSAGSVVAIIISEAGFASALGWGHVGTTAASAVGFVGGAVPNYILNRRWAWRDRRGRNRRTEILLYMGVSLASFLVSAVVTHWVETGARNLTADRGGQVALTTAAFLGVSAVFFVVKFVIYETVVFTKQRDVVAEVRDLAATGTMPPLAAQAEAAESVLN